MTTETFEIIDVADLPPALTTNHGRAPQRKGFQAAFRELPEGKAILRLGLTYKIGPGLSESVQRDRAPLVPRSRWDAARNGRWYWWERPE